MCSGKGLLCIQTREDLRNEDDLIIREKTPEFNSVVIIANIQMHSRVEGLNFAQLKIKEDNNTLKIQQLKIIF